MKRFDVALNLAQCDIWLRNARAGRGLDCRVVPQNSEMVHQLLYVETIFDAEDYAAAPSEPCVTYLGW